MQISPTFKIFDSRFLTTKFLQVEVGFECKGKGCHLLLTVLHFYVLHEPEPGYY